MRDHFNIDIAVAECGKHLASNADRSFKLETNQAQDCHVVDHVNRTILLELLNRILQVLMLRLQVFGVLRLCPLNKRGFRVYSKRDMTFIQFKQIDSQRPSSQYPTDLSEKFRRLNLPVRVHIDDGNLLLDRNCCRSLWPLANVGINLPLIVEKYDGTSTVGFENILDAYGYFWNALFYRKVMDDFGAIERELICFAGVD